MKIETLIRKARISCDWRNHDMKPFRRISDHEAFSECWRCRRTCTVNIRPLPNETDMAGEALATNCP